MTITKEATINALEEIIYNLEREARMIKDNKITYNNLQEFEEYITEVINDAVFTVFY